jgi:hypothetical protein
MAWGAETDGRGPAARADGATASSTSKHWASVPSTPPLCLVRGARTLRRRAATSPGRDSLQVAPTIMAVGDPTGGASGMASVALGLPWVHAGPSSRWPRPRLRLLSSPAPEGSSVSKTEATTSRALRSCARPSRPNGLRRGQPVAIVEGGRSAPMAGRLRVLTSRDNRGVRCSTASLGRPRSPSH